MGLTYLDSCIVIYAVDEDPHWGDRSKTAIATAPSGRLAISPLVKLECLVAPLKRKDSDLARRFQRFFDNLNTLEMTEAVYVNASELRARFGLKTPDTLHLACAQHHGCDALWTNDNRLNKASSGLARNIFARSAAR